MHYPSVYGSSVSQHQKFIHDWVFDRVGVKDGKNCTSNDDCKVHLLLVDYFTFILETT